MTTHIAGRLVQVSAFAYLVFRAWRLVALIHKSVAGNQAGAEPQASRGSIGPIHWESAIEVD